MEKDLFLERLRSPFYLDFGTKSNKEIVELINPNYLCSSKKLKIDDSTILGQINKVNIFVGANNSGKSRFLRGLFKLNQFISYNDIDSDYSNYLRYIKADTNIDLNVFNQITFTLSINNFYLYDNYIDDSIKGSFDIIRLNNERNFTYDINFLKRLSDELFVSDTAGGNSLGFLRVCKAAIQVYKWIFNKYVNSELSEVLKRNIVLGHTSQTTKIFNEERIDELIFFLDKIIDVYAPVIGSLEEKGIKKTYIPILRSLWKISNENSGLVYDKIVKDLYSLDNNNQTHKIHTGLGMHNDIISARNGYSKGRKKFEAFEKFISNTFFKGEKIEIVAQLNDTKTINIFFSESEEERDIHDLGDGIQAIINLLFPIFMANENEWFFIEEPEINLHPGYQRLFLNELLTNKDIKKKNLKFFITTHSNHLLDLSIENSSESSVFSFNKSPDKENNTKEIRNVLGADNNILNLLGVNNSSVFMSNCSIWVEGITERIYIRAFLRAYLNQHSDLNEFKEDINYSFFEYAGSNVAHYYFDQNSDFEKIKATSLNNKILLIADKDNDSKPKRHKELTEQSKENKFFNYLRLDCREIENILTVEQIKSFLLSYNFKTNKTIIHTQLNQLTISKSNLKKDYLGTLISSKVKGLPSTFSDKSGTLGSTFKKLFRDKISEIGLKWDDLSQEAKELTEKVYDFIKESQN